MKLEDLVDELKKPIIPKREEIYKEEVSEEDLMKKKEIYSKIIDFTNRVRRNYGDIIKSVLVFGSAARGEMKKTSDIDLWVILDDTMTKRSQDLYTVKSNIQLLASELKNLHIQTTNLTEFWRWIKMGSPELFNFLRYGLPIYDSGFIKPVQRMLKMGLIPPSEEVVALKSRSADNLLKRVELTMKTIVFDLRYAALDACQSVVMYYYKEQPDAKKLPEFLEKLIKDKNLERKYLEKFVELNKLWKDIDHGNIKKIEPKHVEKALELTKNIVDRMKKLLPKDINADTPQSTVFSLLG